MTARERILASIDQNRPETAPEIKPAAEPEAALPVLAASDQARAELPAGNGGPRSRLLLVLGICLAVGSAGIAGFVVGGRRMSSTPTPARPAAAASTASQSPTPALPAQSTAPLETTADANLPYVVTVRSGPDAPTPAPTVQAPARAFEPPPDRHAAPVEHAAISEPAPALSASATAITPQLPAAVGAPPAPAPPVFRDKPAAPAVAIGGKVQPPVLVRRVNPEFPVMARASHTEGRVRFSAVIGRDGTVKKLERISGPVILQEAAERAIRQWVYQPGVLDGKPVDVDTTIEIDFHIGAR